MVCIRCCCRLHNHTTKFPLSIKQIVCCRICHLFSPSIRIKQIIIAIIIALFILSAINPWSFRIFFRIILPLVKNIFFTVLLVNFIAFWNDYQVPLLYMPRYPTLANGVYMLATTTENNLASAPMRMTGAMLLFLPIFCLFVIFQKRLLGSLTMGGIKG